MVDKSAVGRKGSPFDMWVERGKIREFARATKSAHPEYLDEEQPPITPTFLQTSAFWSPPTGDNPMRDVGMDLRRLLHGEQEFVFPGPPPRAGEQLTVQTRIESIEEKEGKRGGTMTFVRTVTEFRDAAGNLRAESKSTAIETGKPPSKEG